MSTSSSASSSGIGLGGATFLVFLVLKLLGKIAWSWWWVTAPLWMPLGLFLGGFGVFMLGVGVVAVFATLAPKKRRFPAVNVDELRERANRRIGR
jgi:hypothetical protein